MAKYTEKFRKDAVHLYSTLLREGAVQVDSDMYLNNVRELVAFLEISSYSLYKWAEKLGGENIVEIVDKIVEAEEIDFSIENKEMREAFGEKAIPIPMTFKMGTTFFQTLAQGLGIKNYRMPLKQLYLTIGSELIKLSGLVENGVIEELKL